MVDFGEINVKARPFSDYEEFNGLQYRKVLGLSTSISGKKIVHINSTENGGGVAEILSSQVSLEKGLGLNSHWFVIHPPSEFFVITKKIHNFLQGKPGELTNDEQDYYLLESQKLGEEMDNFLQKEGVDLIVTHDPQPLLIGCCNLLPKVPKILRLHIDLSRPNSHTFNFLKPFIETFNKVIVSRRDYRPAWLPVSKTKVIAPAIDPVSVKNLPMPPEEAWEILSRFGINRDHPLISQVSRFDSFKDPLGVIKAYNLANDEVGDIQLVLAGLFEARDDPEAIAELEKVRKYSLGNPGIFIFAKPNELRGIENDRFINAVQTASTVVLQKSLREGFGLTVSEAMWKGKAVIGGNVGGIRLQIESGKSGFLVDTPQETARVIIRLLGDLKLREKIGRKAKKVVAKKFLMPRYLLENLEAYASVF